VNFRFLSQSTEQRRDMILTGSTVRTAVFLSVPTLMLALVQALMPLMDGLFINNAAGTLVASAVTFSTPVINMMTALAQGLSVAAMALVGQLNGRGEYDRSRQTSTQIVVAGVVLGCLSAPLLVVAAFVVSGSVNAQISRDVFLYLALYACVLPFSFLESIYNGIKNANGKPESPFIRMIIMLALKVAFNAAFIWWLRMGIVGCVISSFLANVIVTAWMYRELFVKDDPGRLELRGFRFDSTIVRQIGKIGGPAMLTSFLLNLGFYLINKETEKYGPIVLNGQGIASNITNVCFTLPAAFGSAVTTMVSMHVGAGNALKAKRACLVGCLISALTAICLIAIVVPLSPSLTVLFTRDAAVLAVAERSLHIYTFSVVGFGVCMTIQGAFIGLGRTKVPLVLSVLRIWFLRYVFILATERYLSFYSVFWGNLFSNYTAAAIAILLISRVRWVSALALKDEGSHLPTTAQGD